VGLGTEKVEDTLMQIFPDARVARMDLDTTRTRAAYERIINDFSARRTNLLIGTQMVTKGLDFDHVSVVGILNADSMLNMPDFRAYEHAFMLMAQVSGRAGRKGKRGQVFLQTKNPQLPLIRQVVDNDFEGLYRELCEERAAFHYPPFYRLIYLYMKHRDNAVVESAAVYMASILRQWFGNRVLGPDKPAVARVKDLHIRKMMLKLEQGIDLQAVRQYLRLAQQQITADKRFATVTMFFDVDPL
jgi:primosomal protein N' (replication factor Y)